MFSRRKLKKSKAGFTLAELIIVIALVALIGGMVSGFIVFMTNYAGNNERIADRNSEVLLLRENIDIWFSYADSDNAGFTFSTNSVEVTGGDGNSMSISRNESGDYVFNYGATYPQRTTTVGMTNNVSLCFYKDTDRGFNNANSGALVRFTINLPASNNTFVCEVVYEE